MLARSVFFLLPLAFPAGAFGQTAIGYGTVTGFVRDYTGSGIPDTTVILSNDSLGIRRELDTTDEGAFNGAALVPAAGYTLTVTRKGFLDLEYKDFDVLIGHTLLFIVSLAQEPALARGEVEKPSVRLEDLTDPVQSTLSRSEMSALPSPNRDPNTLVSLWPNVTPDSVSGRQAFHSVASTNAYLTDGVLTANTFFYDKPPVTPPVSQEAVEEMQVLPEGASPEFGHTMGGTINIATRTGGSAIHGAAYDYINNNSLNASDRFAHGFSPSGGQQQFGLNAGGPAPKKIFWFANLEDLTGRSQELNRISNPLLIDPAGTAILPSNCTATAAQCAAAINFLNQQINRLVPTSVHSISGLAKADWRLNESNFLTVEADAAQRHAPNGFNPQTVASDGGVFGTNGTYTDESRYAKVGYTAVWSGNAINEFRGGWYHDRFSAYSDPDLLPSTGTLELNIAGTPFGANPNFPQALSEQRYQYVDNFTFSGGSHLIKVGVDYSTNEDRNDQIIGSGGGYFFPTLTTFADDFSGNTAGHKDYTSFTQGFGLPVVDLHSRMMGFYAQDTWRPIRRLTVNYGVLWEKTFLPQPLDVNPSYYQTGSVSTPDIDVAPRIGLAYELDSHTVVRLGIGSFYQPFPGQLVESLYTGNAIYQLPITITPSQTGSLIYPRVVAAPGSAPTGTGDLVYAANKLRNPFAEQATFGVERHLFSDMTLSMNYVYNRDTKLWTATEQNVNVPTITKTYTIDNAAGAVAGTYATPIFTVKTNTAVAHVYQIDNQGAAWYNALSIQLRKRMSHGFAVQGGYTWSHALDDVSGTPVIAGFIPAAYNPGAYPSDRGNAAFNQANRATMLWTWQPSVAKDGSWMSRYLINGWQFSGLATFSSSLPETPLVLVNGQQFTGVPMIYTNSLNGSGGWSRVPFQPVNSLLTGPQYNIDARITRDIPIRERIKGQLMFEAFNLFNTQFNTSVNQIAYIATSGILKPVSGLGEGTGASGYPWGDNARHLQFAFRVIF
jgi:hypothetical protein